MSNPEEYNTAKSLIHLKQILEKAVSKFNEVFIRSIDGQAYRWMLEKTNCPECSRYYVESARVTCCTPCFVRWMNEDIGDDDVCSNCTRQIKNVLNAEQVDMFCEKTGLNDKTIGPRGHNRHRVLNDNVIEELFGSYER